jgi:anti-anti-sigma regulatory factor
MEWGMIHTGDLKMLDTQELIIVRMPAQIDATNADRIEQDLDEQIRRGEGIVLDLSGTLSVTPEAALLFQRARALAKERGALLTLMGVCANVALVLQSTGVLQHFRRT